MNSSRTWTRTAARLALGLTFTVFGLNGFLNFLPQPAHAGAAGQFLGALAATGYMFPLIKATEVVAGLFLLSGRFTPFALLLLAPVVVNILAFHLFLEPASLGLPLLVLALGVYLAWNERAAYAPLFASGAPALRQSSASPRGHAANAA